MGLLRAIQGLKYQSIKSDSHSDHQKGKRRIGKYSEHTVANQWEENKQYGAEYDGGLLHIPPVNQVNNCNKVTISIVDGVIHTI